MPRNRRIYSITISRINTVPWRSQTPIFSDACRIRHRDILHPKQSRINDDASVRTDAALAGIHSNKPFIVMMLYDHLMLMMTANTKAYVIRSCWLALTISVI